MSMDAINSDGAITDETLDKFNNAIDAQIAKWWLIEYPDEWNSLGAGSGNGDEIRRKLRRVYLILKGADENSLQGGKRKRRRKTKKRRKKNRKKRTKRRR